jgi:hypothetical protein
MLSRQAQQGHGAGGEVAAGVPGSGKEQVMRHIVLSGVVVGLMVVAACGPQYRETQAPHQISGTLQSGMAGIGGEHTGWVLQRPQGAVEVDVSAVQEQAQELDGQQVTVRGQVVQRQYVERGRTPVLRAQQIQPVGPAAEPQAQEQSPDQPAQPQPQPQQ